MATRSKATNSPTGPSASVRIEAVEGGVALAVKVVPGASRSAIVGVWDVALRVIVAAPPEGGKANVAVRKLLAGVFGVKRGGVRIVSGTSRPLKRVAIDGVTVAEVRAAIASVLAGD